MCRGAPFKQAERQPEIGLNDDSPMGRSGVGNGAEMDDGIEPASLQPAEQLAGWHHIGKLALAEIAPFLSGIEGIVDHDVAVAGLVEAGHHVRPDESGAAGDQKHPVRHLLGLLCLRAAGRATLLRGRTAWADKVLLAFGLRSERLSYTLLLGARRGWNRGESEPEMNNDS